MKRHIDYTEYACDFRIAGHCEPSITNVSQTWFEVNDTLHACCNCGHELHRILAVVGVMHNFECNQYAHDKDHGLGKFGIIKVVLSGSKH